MHNGTVNAKSFTAFSLNQGLLSRCVEAVKEGDTLARKTGQIQSFEVFRNGFRMNLVIGRIMIIPPSVCENREDFPVSLLYGALVREIRPEDLSDLMCAKIGESEFDDYDTADMQEIKEKLFKVPDMKKYTSLVLFLPSWTSPREYVMFKYTKDTEALANALRHLVFAVYYDPRLSSAFDHIMQDTDTTDHGAELDVTNITPKLPYFDIAEGATHEYPKMESADETEASQDRPTGPGSKKKKKASGTKLKMVLAADSVNAIKEDELASGEVDVIDAITDAAEAAVLKTRETPSDVAEHNNAAKTAGEPPKCSKCDKVMDWEAGEGQYECTECGATHKKTASQVPCPFCRHSEATPEEIEDHIERAHKKKSSKTADTADNPAMEKDGEGAIEVKTNADIKNTASVKKTAYVAHVPGHTNSKGESAPWVIKQHNTDKILESFKSESAAKEGLKNMESHKHGSGKAAAGHKPGCECGFCKNKGSFGKKKDDESEEKDEPESKTEKKAAGRDPKRVKCDQCNMLSIQGVPCHETGCPNSRARWDAENQTWVKQRTCRECGQDVDTDNSCCNGPVDDDFYDFEPPHQRNSSDDKESISSRAKQARLDHENKIAQFRRTRIADESDDLFAEVTESFGKPAEVKVKDGDGRPDGATPKLADAGATEFVTDRDPQGQPKENVPEELEIPESEPVSGVYKPNAEQTDPVGKALKSAPEMKSPISLSDGQKPSDIKEPLDLNEAAAQWLGEEPKEEAAPEASMHVGATMTEKCPWCKGYARKESHDAPYVCACGWKSKTATADALKPKTASDRVIATLDDLLMAEPFDPDNEEYPDSSLMEGLVSGPISGGRHETNDTSGPANKVAELEESGLTSDAEVIPNKNKSNETQLGGRQNTSERPNINAVREQVEVAQEMDKHETIDEKTEEVAAEAAEEGAESETIEAEVGEIIEAPAGSGKIVININASKSWLASHGMQPRQDDGVDVCVECGQPIVIGLDSPGVSNHVTDDGDIDYDADADHVAIAESGYEILGGNDYQVEPITSGMSNGNFGGSGAVGTDGMPNLTIKGSSEISITADGLAQQQMDFFTDAAKTLAPHIPSIPGGGGAGSTGEAAEGGDLAELALVAGKKRAVRMLTPMTSPSTNHNGWHNWETWHVNLLINNTESSYTTKRNLVARALKEAKGQPVNINKLALQFSKLFNAQYLETKEFSDNNAREMPDSEWAREPFGEVNWVEIAEHAVENEEIERTSTEVPLEEPIASKDASTEKEAGFNFFFPGQVLREFYPEVQHEVVDYPNADNKPMIQDVDLQPSKVGSVQRESSGAGAWDDVDFSKVRPEDRLPGGSLKGVPPTKKKDKDDKLTVDYAHPGRTDRALNDTGIRHRGSDKEAGEVSEIKPFRIDLGAEGVKGFTTLEEARKFAQHIFYTTGVVVGIVDIRNNKNAGSDKKTACPCDHEGTEKEAGAPGYVSTDPGAIGIGRDGKPQVLDGAPLRKENDIRGPMFSEEFYSASPAIPGKNLVMAGSINEFKKKAAATADQKEMLGDFLKKVMGEIVATFCAAFKITNRPIQLDKVPGVGEVYLVDMENSGNSALLGLGEVGGRIKFLLEKMNDSDVQDCINEAWSQAAIWHSGSGSGNFTYEVFARAESIDTDSLILKYEFVTGTKN